MIELVHAGLLGIAAFAALWFGYTKNFFEWNPERPWDSKVYLHYVLLAFAIYFCICLFFAPACLIFLKKYCPQLPRIGIAAWLNFFNSTSILLGLTLLWRCLPVSTRKGIIQCQEIPKNLIQDVKMGAFAWILSFPLVLFLTTFLEWFVLYVLKAGFIPDQLAVYFVKMTFADPFYFALTILTIVILTPLVEETLFRGFLQSFIRRHLGSKQAILITATCFALFHYSPEQGFANIPIVGTLFGLALFLGFLYEKQRSLLASISLHALFNGISIINLYFLGKIPCFF
jgi:hypothetical protein